MLITRTPFRVSFVGGGTDLPAFYTQEAGAVVSMTIDQYVYITVNRRFDDTLRISYSQTENVNALDEIHHPLFREAARCVGVHFGVEITSIADIPSGTGLGSSSSFTVGLIHALQAYRGRSMSAHELAEQACHLELDILREPIGKQDQYAAAFGGLRKYEFHPDGTVSLEAMLCSEETRQALLDHLMFFYLGGNRDARQILAEQSGNTNGNMAFLRRIRGLVADFESILARGTDLPAVGGLLHEAWLCKKQLAKNISSPRIDEVYERARAAGASGGKILGAGMGGFLMLFCEPRHQEGVERALPGLRRMQFGYEPAGSRIIYGGV